MSRFLVILVLATACNSVVPREFEEKVARREAAAKAHEEAVRELLVLETTAGRLIFRLFPDSAPETVDQARTWVEDGIYNGTWFHRVVTEPVPFIVQGGDPETASIDPPTNPVLARAMALDYGYGTTDPPLAVEKTPRRHTAGALALAVAHDGSRAGPQFVVTLSRFRHLDETQPVFGQLVGGWSSLLAIRAGDRVKKAYLEVPEDIEGDWMNDLPPADANQEWDE